MLLEIEFFPHENSSKSEFDIIQTVSFVFGSEVWTIHKSVELYMSD